VQKGVKLCINVLLAPVYEAHLSHPSSFVRLRFVAVFHHFLLVSAHSGGWRWGVGEVQNGRIMVKPVRIVLKPK